MGLSWFKSKGLSKDYDLADVVVSSFLSNLMERDENYKDHYARVSEYVFLLAQNWHLDEETLCKWRFSALVHDVGKLVLPRYVLNKKSPLTFEEKESFRKGQDNGRKILQRAVFAQYPDLRNILLEETFLYRERLDGRGPRKLSDGEIPILPRLIAVADFYDTLTTATTYRAARKPSEVLFLLEEGSGTSFDPLITTKFIERFRARFPKYQPRPTLLTDKKVPEIRRKTLDLIRQQNDRATDEKPLYGLSEPEMTLVLERTTRMIIADYQTEIHGKSLADIVSHTAKHKYKPDIMPENITLTQEELDARVKESFSGKNYIELVLDVNNVPELKRKSIVLFSLQSYEMGDLWDMTIINDKKVALMKRKQ